MTKKENTQRRRGKSPMDRVIPLATLAVVEIGGFSSLGPVAVRLEFPEILG